MADEKTVNHPQAVINTDEMGEEELAKIKPEDFAPVQDKETPPAMEQEKESGVPDKTESAESENPPEGAAEKAKEEVKAKEPTPEEKLKEDRRKGFEERKKRDSERRQKEEAQAKRFRDLEIENLKLKAGSFKPLTETELTELAELDGKAYHEYRVNEEKAKATQKQLEDLQRQHGDEDSGKALTKFHEEFCDFAASQAGLVLDEPVNDYRLLPKEAQDYLASDEFKKVDAAVMEIYGEWMGKGIYPTFKMIETVAEKVNKGKLTAAAAEQLKTSIDKAAENTSPLNRADKAGTQKERDWSKLTPKEVDELGEADLEKMNQWVEERFAASR